MTAITKISIFCAASLALLAGGCSKSKFLDASPDSSLFIPATLEDFQALLDNESIMNETPALGEVSADNFYLPASFWNNLNTKEKNAYVWATDIFQGQGEVSDYNIPYKQAFYANVILEGLPKVEVNSGNQTSWNEIKGAALFARAHAFYQIAQIFAPVYNKETADTDLGIPLRLAAGVDEESVRSSVQESYERIIEDLKEAAPLLNASIPVNNRNRSSRPAAFALLARTYLSMGEYQQAKLYADSCLLLYNKLLIYNDYNFTSTIPFKKNNDETIYQTRYLSTTTNSTGTNVLKSVTNPSCIIDTFLYRSYAVNDLRSSAFFMTNMQTGNIIPRGGYSGLTFMFTGIAVDEVYLIRAECNARLGLTSEAMSDLNTLLVTRWKANTFNNFTASNATQALSLILQERRKELPFRSLRWTDIRRYNLSDSSISLTRKINNDIYTLPARSLKFTLPLPPDVINLTHMQQNPR